MSVQFSKPARGGVVALVLTSLAVFPGQANSRQRSMTRSGNGGQEVSGPSAGKAREHPGKTIRYRNTRYDFCFSLPEGWRGYSIVVSQWHGLAGGPHGEGTIQHGLIIAIRSPEWTAARPRQDIPIMIFAQAQWRLLQQHVFSVGAAPVGPTKLGSNSRFVFAVPARYNFAFPPGYKEVERILNSHPLKAPCVARPSHS